MIDRMTTVLIVEDHPLYRDGVVRAVSSDPRLRPVGVAADGPTALVLAEELEPDIALLDLRVPGLDGIEVCARITAHRPPLPTRVVLLSAYQDSGLVALARRAGAAAFLGKEASRAELCDALVAAATQR